jgi:hypothetical protein
MALHHARVDLIVAQQVEHMLKTRFAVHRSHFNAINPTAFVTPFDLPIVDASGSMDDNVDPLAGNDDQTPPAGPTRNWQRHR